MKLSYIAFYIQSAKASNKVCSNNKIISYQINY